MVRKNLSAYLSRNHSLLYIATPKVACTTLKWWFARLIGVDVLISPDFESVESDPDLIIHDALSRLLSDSTDPNEIGLSTALTSADYFRFCVVRNPFTRAFSGWQSKWLLREPLQSGAYCNAFDDRKIKTAADIRDAFEFFLHALSKIEDTSLHDPHMMPQACLLNIEAIHYSLIGRIENTSPLEEALAKHLGDSYIPPFLGSDASKNVSLLPYSSSWISDTAANLIREIYARDFEVFGYDSVIPTGAEPLSNAAMALAARSITMLRGRNQRISVLICDKVPWMRSEYERLRSLEPSRNVLDSIGRVTHLYQELVGLVTLTKQALSVRDKMLSNQSVQINLLQTELIRAEAQLALLKDVLLEGHDEDRI